MDRSPETNRIATTLSSSSPPVQESPLSNFLSNLSPIDTVKAASYTGRLLETNLPTPPIVFASPHIAPQRETSFLGRDDIVEASSDVYKQCNTSAVQNPCFEKEVQLCSPPACVDEYLVADPADVYCTIYADLRLQHFNEVPRLSHRGFTACKESNTEVNDFIDGRTESESLASSDRAEGNLPLSSLQLIESEVNQRDDKKTEEFLRFISEKVKESSINVDLVSGAQNCGQNAAKVNLQSAGCQHDEQNAGCQSYEESNESKRKVIKGYFKEAGQHQRGIRRHLQFEAAIAHKSTTVGNSESLCSLTHDTADLRSHSVLKNFNSLVSSHFEERASSSSRAVNCGTSQFPSCLYESVTSAQIGGNSATSVPIHSGIGLHLNSIARSTSMNSDIFSSKKPTGYLSAPELMLQHDNSNNIAVDSSSSLISSVSGEPYSRVGDGQQGSQAVAEANSFIFHPTDSMRSPCDSLHMILVDQKAAPCDEGMSASQDADKVEELNQLSLKKRRRTADMSEGCKRCNCKRSKCLKLYCECFAAGVYCLDTCACENCYNKPEFEDTVLDTRQQIESRNPLAFAPKVVTPGGDSLAKLRVEGNWMTPSSARHKRGCNCKKSKCLKKYCECYQAKVGCSSGCRCDGCQNTFGTKAEPIYNRAEKWETNPSEKLDTVKAGIDCIKGPSINQYSPTWEGLSDIRNLTPLSHPCSHTVISSALPSIGKCSNFSQAQLPSSRLHSSGTSRSHMGCSPDILNPQLSESKGPHELSSGGARYDISDDDTPEILEETSNLAMVVKASSPNQKRVSPPQSGSELRSSSPTGLRGARKFILQGMPSFPPLTPYSKNSKDSTNKIGDDHKATNNNLTTQKELRD